MMNDIIGTYSLPEHIATHIQFIDGITSFPPQPSVVPVKLKRGLASGAPVNTSLFAVVPQTVSAMYGIPDNDPPVAQRVSQGVLEFDFQSYDPADLQIYSRLVDIPIQPLTDEHIVGPNDPKKPKEEGIFALSRHDAVTFTLLIMYCTALLWQSNDIYIGTLDIQLMAGTNPLSPQWFWIQIFNTWLYHWAFQFNAATDVPQVLAISYGTAEAVQCRVDAKECGDIGMDVATYIDRVNNEFMKMGLRGITVIVASGDG
jgi:hypothetical protein